MNNALVSVVIPTCQRGYCIEKTVRAVLDQTYQNIEIIVVDDGSTDDTGDIIKRLQSEDSRIKYFWKPNGGVSSARNFAFRRVEGDYIALLDSDDLWYPWKLEMQILSLRNNPTAGMIFTDVDAIDEKGNITRRYMRKMYAPWRWWDPNKIFSQKKIMSIRGEKDVVALLYVGQIFSEMMMGSLVPTPSVVLTRSRLKLVGDFNEELKYSGEDFDFHLRTCRIGPVAFLDIPTLRI
jgi:glycosyltransferase involved in cell wall biosynthesis